MASVIKRIMRHFNGTDWDKYYPETSADQVKFTKTDGTESNLQTEVSGLNSKISTLNGGLKRKSFTATTDAYGNLQLPVDPTCIVVSFIPDATDYVQYTLGTSGGTWFAKIIMNTNGYVSMANSSISGTVFYF